GENPDGRPVAAGRALPDLRREPDEGAGSGRTHEGERSTNGSEHPYHLRDTGVPVRRKATRYNRDLRSSNEAEYSSARNSATVRTASPTNTWSTTPIVPSLWNGTSTCSRETRLTEMLPHDGQWTAMPTASLRPPGAIRTNEEGNTGRGRCSG